MRFKVRPAYLFAVLAIFMQIWIPRGFNIKYIFLFVLFFLLCAKKKFVLRNIFPVYAIPYIVTYISIYIIHFYDGSISSIFVFIVNLIVVRYLVLNGINSYEDFNRTLSHIVDLFALYAIVCIIETFMNINIIDIIFNRDVVINYGANSFRFNMLRAHGMCTISINNGMLLTMGWGIAAYKLLNNNGGGFKLITEYLLIGLATILSLSRAVIIAALGIQVLLVIKRGYSFALKRIVAFVMIFGICYLVFNNTLMTLVNSAKQLILSGFSSIIPSFAKYIESGSNIGNQGDRFDLWSWVYEAVKSNLVIGNGYNNPFSKIIWQPSGLYTVKTSIEVHWLSTLYSGGLIGLAGFITYQVGCLFILIKNKVKFVTEKISFQYLILAISICYFISLFTYTGFEDLSFFYLLMALFESYININKSLFDKNNKQSKSMLSPATKDDKI